MRTDKWPAQVAAIVCTGLSLALSEPQNARPSRAHGSTEDAVSTFALSVARDVTREGPAAWRRHFSNTPAFFMAAEGRLVFADSESATTGIRELEKTIKHIELEWGEGMRVDSFAPGFAMVAMPYREVREDLAGRRVSETGYFTGLAEFREGRWQFRNAHWSVVGPPSAVK